VDRAQYRWHKQKPYHEIRFVVLKPRHRYFMTGRLYCTPACTVPIGVGVGRGTAINSPSQQGNIEAVLDPFECRKARQGKAFRLLTSKSTRRSVVSANQAGFCPWLEGRLINGQLVQSSRFNQQSVLD
jgi:hypothetical protein